MPADTDRVLPSPVTGESEAPSDRALVESVRAGSRDAAEAIVRRYLPDAFRAAFLMTGNRQIAEDVVQDTFERALRSIASYDASRPFGAWLHRIVVNRVIDLRRAETKSVELDENLVAARDPYEAAAASRELIDAVRALSDDHRDVVVLRLLLGYSPNEVAKMLEVEVGTVHSRLSRALSELRARIGVSDGV